MLNKGYVAFGSPQEGDAVINEMLVYWAANDFSTADAEQYGWIVPLQSGSDFYCEPEAPAPELKACTCKNTWADEWCDDPQATQTGCTKCDQDEAGSSWCIVDEAPCAGSEDGEDWFYCEPDSRRLSATGAPQVQGTG